MTVFNELDIQRDQPLQDQIYRFISQNILSQRLQADTRLPSSRQLAELLGVSRNTVNASFDQLRAEGFIVSRVGSGWYVNADRFDDRVMAKPVASSACTPLLACSELAGSVLGPMEQTGGSPLPFTTGLPDLKHFPFGTWNRLYRQNESRVALMGYGEYKGLSDLRNQISIYLRESRGVSCHPEQILLTQGAQQALYIVISLLVNPGDEVLIENPGYGGMHKAAQMAQAKPLPVDVDEHGLKVSLLPSSTKARLLYCTPTHQYPLGGILDVSERLQLLDWARNNQVWIIEDDYDSEFHFYQKPFPAMHSLVSEAPVIYLGSFSKTLFPALRMGYLVLPEALMPAAVSIKECVQGFSPALEQAVLAQFMAEGHFSRHLRRMRQLYQKKWELLIGQWQSRGNETLTPVVQSAGMHVVLRGDIDEQQTLQLLKKHGFGGAPLSAYFINRHCQTGLVLGYANASQQQIIDLVELLRQA
ncbi:PLP-dependent aminotransferase family protein [Gynuella sunshinyii]|uniref:Transcriptional regulator containing a DNA-binding HTH domain and an aminotransferase domain (MocR family-like protein) n=1 Tax=Gynuella sunshinyii YC6258 TaxID=1445510 RepID=A0A0C5W0R7_9GAMM|nr:PLP-dependent aminotransferase family protein [Gynuella sunshinyii]AJQ96259.1 transcriptional regulator containing a DNA-binding HTH domain and an aminotransferase domain (MocR family-like protein) [Gynuella sunshinyii YC6258]